MRWSNDYTDLMTSGKAILFKMDESDSDISNSFNNKNKNKVTYY